ncbi:hypothetical protein [Streptomyces cyslabdanicus]|uniref:hypothetical protein n=1 Tax=Streptomyces cyslabdanicus TaxID=1470456 RepID=UPI0040451A2F
MVTAALRSLDLSIAWAMAAVLGATLSAMASAPAETSVADLRRELRIVLRFKRTFLRNWEGPNRKRSALSALRSHACHVPLATDETLFTHGEEKYAE